MKNYRMILAMAWLCTAAAWAGSVTGTPAKVSQTGVKSYYQSAGKATGQPSCASGNPGRFVIDTSTDEGRSYERKLSTAFALNKAVFMEVTGTCSIDQNAETLKHLDVVS